MIQQAMERYPSSVESNCGVRSGSGGNMVNHGPSEASMWAFDSSCEIVGLMNRRWVWATRIIADWSGIAHPKEGK